MATRGVSGSDADVQVLQGESLGKMSWNVCLFYIRVISLHPLFMQQV